MVGVNSGWVTGYQSEDGFVVVLEGGGIIVSSFCDTS